MKMNSALTKIAAQKATNREISFEAYALYKFFTENCQPAAGDVWDVKEGFFEGIEERLRGLKKLKAVQKRLESAFKN